MKTRGTQDIQYIILSAIYQIYRIQFYLERSAILQIRIISYYYVVSNEFDKLSIIRI